MSEPSQAVFLSYASEDAPAAQRIAEALRAGGIEVWFDKSELRGGDAWDRQIRKQIHDCALFIPIISSHSQARLEGYFRREWKLATDRTHDMAEEKAFLVPVVIDDTSERNASVPDRFRDVQWSRLPGGETPPAFSERVFRLLSVDHAQASEQPSPLPARARSSSLGSQEPAGTVGPFWRWGHILWGLAAIVVVAVGYLAVDRLWLSKHIVASTQTTPSTGPSAAPARGTIPEKSIAVLPFADMSEKHDQEYFADGLAEEVLSLLATLPDLKVISRTSSFQFKGRNADLRTVGTQLGAANLVEGSVRRYGDRVRVTAQLISTQDGAHRWSDIYERPVGDILRMQQEIAAALGRALQVEVGNAPWQTATTLTSTEAYTSYLRGLHAMDRFDKEGLEEAVSYFEQALAVDPSLTRARERLGQADYLLLGFGFVPPAIGADHLRRDIDSILHENSRSAMGHALRSELLSSYDWNWAEAQREAELGLSLAKNDSFALHAAGDVATALGRWEQAETLLRQALWVDPLDAETHDLFSWMLFHAGRFTEAEAEARRALEIRPSFGLGHFDLALYLLAQGKLQAGLSEMQREKIEGFQSAGLAIAFHALRRKADSDASLRRAEHNSAQDAAYAIACAHAFRGETNAAFQWLERAYVQKDFLLEYIEGEWALKSLQRDPRYKAFLRKMNLPEQPGRDAPSLQ